MGFTGLAVTDDLAAMKAITDQRTTPDAAVAALAAGADVAIVGPMAAYDAVLARVEQAATSGELPAARVTEALHHVRTAQGCPA